MKNTVSVFQTLLARLRGPRATIPLVVLLLFGFAAGALAQGTAFTQEGRLNDGHKPATGLYDLRFTIYDASAGGNLLAGPLTNSAASVTNGLFTVTLDFGAGVFTGAPRWLEIAVRTNGGADFTALSPRQLLAPAPYAIMAGGASNLLGTLPASQLSGAIANSQLASSGLTVNAGAGLSGGGTVPLGGTTTLNNTGVLSVTGDSDITASTVNGAVTLGVTATSANTANAIVRRDAGGSFCAGNLKLNGNMTLPPGGIIYAGSCSLLRGDYNYNFCAGQSAGNLTMSGSGNTASGVLALANNMNGADNTASGFLALYSNLNGTYNTASGYQALYSNSSGSWNTADGLQALFANTSGFLNTANGAWALQNNTTGQANTACGAYALCNNVNGYLNTASGYGALSDNTCGSYNTANGYQALCNNTNGANNIALGYQAGYNLVTGNNNIYIGSQGAESETGVIRIGTPEHPSTTFIAGIYNASVSGEPVVVNSSGQLGVSPSSRRFKQDIQDMGGASDVLLALRPVSFHYEADVDPKATPQFGLVAEEVEEVDPELVVHDQKGQPYSVRYQQVNAMLLNEFLKEHRKVEAQNARIQALEQSVAELKAAVAKLTSR